MIMTMDIFPDDFFYNAPNNNGSLGVINIPSARFYNSPAGFLSFYRGSPDRKAVVSLYPYDWLEASVFYSSIKGKEYGIGFSQDYKDKGFNLKIRLKEQDNLPAIAIGVNDIGGTGLYSSEYIVSSYSFDNYDFHIGAGWGMLNEFDHLKNPFISLSDDFKTRTLSLGKGGTFNFKNLFSGSNISIFAGMNYALNNHYVFKIEYDPTQTPGLIGYEKRKSDFNIGLNFLKSNYVFGLNFERGSNLSFNFSFRDNFFIPKQKYRKNIKTSNNKYNNLIRLLRINEIGVSKIETNASKTSLTITQNKHNFYDLENLVQKSILDSGFTEEIIKTYKIAGLEVIKSEDIENSETIFRNDYKGINQQFSFNVRPFIAGREDFLKFALFLEHDSETVISENFFFSTNIKLSLFDNFDDLIYPPVNTYPEQVRSDVKKYLNNIGDSPAIGRAQFEYIKTLSTNNHLMLTGGIYEDMFSGFGFEYINYSPERHFNWGYEMHQVYKRDYKFKFGLLDYKNITYHANFYYKNRNLIPFDLKVSFGEYLAGDKGVTYEITRSFSGGVRFGAFASFTDVSFENFGEGSFDKGIFFSIPFGKNRKISKITWRPLTKDPAQKLIRKNNIYDLADKYSKIL